MGCPPIMKDIGIRELKAQASHLVRRVAEEHATYTITCRGRAVGILGPSDFLPLAGTRDSARAWDRVLALAERVTRKGGRRKSAVRELKAMRR